MSRGTLESTTISSSVDSFTVPVSGSSSPSAGTKRSRFKKNKHHNKLHFMRIMCGGEGDKSRLHYIRPSNLPVGASLSASVSDDDPKFTAVMYLSLWSHTRRKERDELDEDKE